MKERKKIKGERKRERKKDNKKNRKSYEILEVHKDTNRKGK